jgi:hypothetical protein
VSAMTSVTSPMQNYTLPSCGVHSSTRQGTINPLTCGNGSFPTLRQGQSWCMSFDPLRTRFVVAAVPASLGRCGCQRQRICVPAKKIIPRSGTKNLFATISALNRLVAAPDMSPLLEAERT